MGVLGRACCAALLFGCSGELTSEGGADPDGGGPQPVVLPNEGCSPLAEPIAGCSPTALEPTGDPHVDCVARINQFRAECQCLPPLERWVEAEDCADQQAEHDANGGGPHGGWSMRICDPRGNAQNECPGWRSFNQARRSCFQQMWDEGPGPFDEGHGHYLNMSSTRFTRVACGIYVGSEGTWVVQNFR